MSLISVEHFVFTRHRAGSPDLAFGPDAGADLVFCSLSDDTLTLGKMRSGVLRSGDRVSVARGGATVFAGDVESSVWHGWRGSSVEESFTVYGPWHRLARLPFTQTWVMMVERLQEDGSTVTAAEEVASSRAVLNQSDAGASYSVREQVLEIMAVAAGRGIIAQPEAEDVAAIPAGLTIPYDECRDLTCAQALARELRFTPSLAVRFDYSVEPPAIRILSPAEENAGWLADFALAGTLLDVRETQSGLPPLGCLLEIQVTGSMEGVNYSFSSAQEAGDTSDPERTLRAVLPLSGAEASHDRRKLDLTVEDIPDDLNAAAFWRIWHPDLKGAPVGGLTISNASRTGTEHNEDYPYFVTKGGVGMAELEEAGIAHFRAERLTCTAVITTSVYAGDGKEVKSIETAEVSLDIIATDATTRTYKWDASADMTSGETAPAGMAAALLAAHQADGSSAEALCSLKTGAALPRPGDTRNGLTAHTVSVDCRALSVSVGFGPPAALGPVDLAGFLAGFRNLRRTTISTVRDTGEKKDGAEKDETFMLPATSSGWVKKGDNVLSATPAPGGTGGTATIDPADLKPGDAAKFREIKIPVASADASRSLAAGAGAAQSYQYYKVLATEATDEPTSDPGDGDMGDGCQHDANPDGSASGGGGGGGDSVDNDAHDGSFPDTTTDNTDHSDGAFPGKTGPCW